MTPEAKAREVIDRKLAQAGWVIQDFKHINLGAAPGIAVREYPTDTGPADYVLFVHREPVGVIEAKRDEEGENITAHEAQTERYANATLKWRVKTEPLPFLFESTSQLIRFTEGRDPEPRSREAFHFFKPEQLAAWHGQPDTLRRRLADNMPALPERNLRECQVSAVTGLERSLAQNKPRALVHMATGAGKTFTAITSVYRLLKFTRAKRILFLVDTCAAEHVTELAVKECRLELYPAGSLLVAMYGEGKTRGKCSELLIPAAINQAIAAIVLEPEAQACKAYVKAFLLDSYERMRAQASGGVQPNLNLQIVKSIALPLPPSVEQTEITKLLLGQFDQVARQQVAVDFGLKQAAAQRKNILRAAFVGQLIPQDTNDEPASVLMERIRAERATTASASSARGRRSKVAA